MNTDNCPHCKVSLIGDLIPDDIKQHYSGTHWRREIGIEYTDKYDGVWEYECPDCKGRWPSEVARLKETPKPSRWPY
jgi:hypothetical protein